MSYSAVARLNYFIYLAALRLLEARADCWTAVVVSVVVCITIPMIVNNLGLVSSQICMRFCQTSSATTETSHNFHLASRIVVVGRNFYKLAGWLMLYVICWILNTICQISQFNVVSPLISWPGLRLRFIYLGRPHAWLAAWREPVSPSLTLSEGITGRSGPAQGCGNTAAAAAASSDWPPIRLRVLIPDTINPLSGHNHHHHLHHQQQHQQQHQ